MTIFDSHKDFKMVDLIIEDEDGDLNQMIMHVPTKEEFSILYEWEDFLQVNNLTDNTFDDVKTLLKEKGLEVATYR